MERVICDNCNGNGYFVHTIIVGKTRTKKYKCKQCKGLGYTNTHI